MTLAPGQMLSHYRLIEKIGEGGMGVVWKALDPSLDREVAVKLLPEAFAGEADRLARFEREAKLLASLSHPFIATVYGLHEHDGVHFIAMELVPGETLAQRLQRGALPLDEGLELARQVADALEAAHERGVIHRDLKPANIKVTPDGVVKVLDFGLAKSLAGPADGNASSSPTVTSGGTQAGAVLGTAAYMSPEQARGKPLDRRTDIWSFGCVLYEMLGGRRCFGGETPSDTLVRILEHEPDWDALPGRTPANVRALLRRSLVKDPRRRLRDIGEVRVAAEDHLAGRAPDTETSPQGSRRAPMPWAVAALATICAVWLGWIALRPVSTPPRRPMRLVVSLPRDQQLAVADAASLAISPDGSRIVYAASSPPGSRHRLYLRELDRFESVPIPGTEGAVGPFFSPDGRWLGYFAEARLFKILLEGGTPLEICHVGQVVPGACWGEDDTILFSDNPDSGLIRISAEGGAAEQITTPAYADGELGHRWPRLLPGGESVLFTITGAKGTSIAVLSLRTGEWHTLDKGVGGARYLSSGHLVYARFEGLAAVPFDPVNLRTTGAPVIVLEDVYTVPALSGTGLAAFAVSDDGRLVYLAGGVEAGRNRLVWVDREGRSRPASRTVGSYEWPRLSPEGTRLAVTNRALDGQVEIWVVDIERDAHSRLTFNGGNILPTWTPDGARIAFASIRGGSNVVQLYWKAADASAEASRLLEGSHPRYPQSWSADGRWLAITEWNPDSMRDIWILDRGGTGEARPIVNTPFDEHSPMFSPDGRWLAYVSVESGRAEVYVESFPQGRGRWLVSAGGGKEPVWSADGTELFYRNDDAMLVVPIRTHPEFEVGAPRTLFERALKSGVYDSLSYDVTRDGREFLMIERPLELAPTQLNVVLDWTEELRRRAPVDSD